MSGSVTYTSVGATLRGYTVVVPIDATLDATDFEIAVGRYQILHQSSANAGNEPLKTAAKSRRRGFTVWTLSLSAELIVVVISIPCGVVVCFRALTFFDI